MTKTKHNYQSIEEFISLSDPSIRPIIARLRKLFNEYSSDITEHIKWNSPAFYFKHLIPNYDAKSYIKDFVVFNTYKDYVLLVFPNGAIISGDHKILEGKFSDNRKTIKLKTLEAVNTIESELRSVIDAYITDLKKQMSC